MRFFLLLILVTVAGTARAADVDGLWLTENKRAAIHVTQCENGRSLCGSIAWIIDGGMQMDVKNDDPAKQNTPLCGMQILYGFEKGKAAGEWVDGKIYKADDGDVYNATVKQIDDTRLRLRGYVGIPLFGKTQIWTRVSPADYPRCGA